MDESREGFSGACVLECRQAGGPLSAPKLAMCHAEGDGEWHWVEGVGAQGVTSARHVCG